MIGMLLARGAEGLPPPLPLDIAQLRLPASPNAALAAPPGVTTERHEPTALRDIAPDAAWGVLRALGEGRPRVWVLGEFAALRQIHWVERSGLMNFPDIIVGQVVTLPGGTGYWLYSRSLIGYSDLGVNAKRIAAWREDLERRLGAL
jgi:uncharacterized protein (DUF1499 family)